jgi:hypothetical protein
VVHYLDRQSGRIYGANAGGPQLPFRTISSCHHHNLRFLLGFLAVIRIFTKDIRIDLLADNNTYDILCEPFFVRLSLLHGGLEPFGRESVSANI